MQDILSKAAMDTLRDRYFAGVTSAEIGFKNNREDEDSVTGALGQALLTPLRQVQIGGSHFAYEINHYKLRGRGKGAEEKLYGADGIFQIRVMDFSGRVLRKKGLLFQAKKEWSGKDVKVADQAGKMIEHSSDSIVIDFRDTGYETCHAKSAIQAEGDRRKIAKEEFSTLSKTLGIDFVECTVGEKGLYYDEENRQIVKGDQETEIIDTTVINYS